MKIHKIISPLAIVLMLISCNSNFNQPDLPLLYNGIVVSESVPDFMNKGHIGKSVAPNAQIESSPPYGTVYGLESIPDSVYLCQGGELLPDGSWADQIYNETYKTTLFGNSKAEFDDVVTVTVSNPVDIYYLDGNGNWIQITSDLTIQTSAVMTGPNGFGDLESSTICRIGNGGNNG